MNIPKSRERNARERSARDEAQHREKAEIETSSSFGDVDKMKKKRIVVDVEDSRSLSYKKKKNGLAICQTREKLWKEVARLKENKWSNVVRRSAGIYECGNLYDRVSKGGKIRREQRHQLSNNLRIKRETRTRDNEYRKNTTTCTTLVKNDSVFVSFAKEKPCCIFDAFSENFEINAT